MQVLVEGDETKNRVCVVYVWFLAFLYIYMCVYSTCVGTKESVESGEGPQLA